MFAIPLVGLRGVDSRQPIWLKFTASSGFLMTLLYVGVSIIPIIQVESRFMFALKIGGLIVITNLLGLAILFAIGKRRADTQLVSARLS
jgi:hypothetical protein